MLAWLLYFVFLTGSAGYFNAEIDRWMRPEAAHPPAATAGGPAQDAMIATAVAHLRAVAPNATEWFVTLPTDRKSTALQATARLPKAPDGTTPEPLRVRLDRVTGAPLPVTRDTGGGNALYAMHYALHYVPGDVAMYAVGAATMFMLLAIVTGVVVHKKIFRDFFTFRPAKGQRSWLDAHNATSVLALPFMVMITYSGLVFYLYDYMPAARQAAYGTGAPANEAFRAETQGLEIRPEPAGRPAALAPLAPMLATAERAWGPEQVARFGIYNPGDANARVRLIRRDAPGVDRYARTLLFDGTSGALLQNDRPPRAAARTFADVLLGLHEGLFAGPALRWLYFASGLLGGAMVATGLVLWTTKRRERVAKRGEAGLGLRLVERLNVGTVVGLPIAIAVYFWANRLLPTPMPDRADWEMHALFVAWSLLLVHAMLRPATRAWSEQFALGALAFGLLPIVNALTTDLHLGRTLPAGDWVLAGFDLTMLAFAVACALGAWRTAPGATGHAGARRPRARHRGATPALPEPAVVRASLGETGRAA